MSRGALRVERLRVTVGGGRAGAARAVSFDIAAGEAVGLVGESGSGETLTCRSVLGVPPGGRAVSQGRHAFGETNVTTLDSMGRRVVRGARIGAVFQDPASHLNPSLAVGRQLAERLRVGSGLSRLDARTGVLALLAAMGLRHPTAVFDRFPHELSGGMLQRVRVAFAVAADPDLLVADEATSALDVAQRAEVLELLARLCRERGLAMLLVSHDLAMVAETCDRVVVRYAGEIVEDGPTAEVVANPRHPYTEALLRVASRGTWDRRSLEVVPRGSGYVDASCAAAAVPLVSLDDAVARCTRAGTLALAGTAS